jgi:hypothetical protein
MFAQARVLDLSDDELATTIEYHRSIMGEMLNEREARKIAANKKNLAVMIKHSTLKIPNLKTKTNTDGTDLIGMDSTTVTTTTVKRTRISATQTNSTQVALTAIIAMMKAQGLSDEQVKAKLIAMAGGSK